MGVYKIPIVVAFILLLLVDALYGQKLLQLVNAPGAYKARHLRIAHPVFHHTLAANYSGFDEWGSPYSYCTDKNGFRASCDSASNDEKNFDYAFLGDSMLEGLGIPYEQTIVGRFAKLTGKTALNFSVSSYSPSIHAEKLKFFLQEGFKFKNIVIFLDISDIEDEARIYIRRDGKVVDQKEVAPSSRFERRLRHSVEATIPLIWHGVSVVKRQIKNFGRPEAQPWTVETDRSSARAGWTYLLSDGNAEVRAMAELGLQRSEAALHDIAEMARQADANLYLVLYPWPHQIMFDGDEKNELERWAERVAKSTGSLLINGLAAFREERRHRGATEMIRSYYIQADTHFSSMGHERVANLLENSLNPSSIRAPAR